MSIDPFHRRVVLLTAAVLGLVGACSLPVDERVTPLDQRAIPDDLTEPTTTTTTTTSTTVPPTTAPQDTGVDSVDTTTTTQPTIPTETVTVYYTRGPSDVMQPVGVPRPVLTPVEELVSLLERPTGIGELRTSLLPGLIDDISPVERATVTVVLDPDILDRMSEPNRQRAIAQIVLTLTSFVTADAGAIGLVRFEVDGEGFSVFVPGFGGSSEPGEPLAFDDFSSLIVTSPSPTTATTTTTTLAAATSEPSSEADGQ
jgi:hypothetical protein